MNFLGIDQTCTLIRLRQFSEAGAALVEQATPFLQQNPLLVVDAEQITFSSMQIGELLNLHKRFEAHWAGKNHSLSLINVSPHSCEVLKTAKLDQVFHLCDTLRQALDGFSRGETPAQGTAG